MFSQMRKIGFLLSGAAILIGSTGDFVFAQTKLNKTVDAYIAKQAKAEQASEYAEARKIVQGDLDGDGDRDAAVLYSLEGLGGGGNNWIQLLAIFRNDKGNYKFVAENGVGGKLSRSFDLIGISGGKINGSTETCPNDTPQGLCENPKKAKVSFTLKNNKLLKK